VSVDDEMDKRFWADTVVDQLHTDRAEGWVCVTGVSHDGHLLSGRGPTLKAARAEAVAWYGRRLDRATGLWQW